MKPNFENYISWFNEKFSTDLYSKPSQIFGYVIQKLNNDVQECLFWKELQENLENFNDEYYLKNGYQLLRNDELELFSKSYKSLINKSFRKNILQNDNFPDEPENDWITPENWFYKINDLLRTTITVKYLDGVEFVVEKIKELALAHDFEFAVDYEAREEGYYAAHITLINTFNIVDDNWNSIEINLPIEIQITTQLQEVIKGLLHKYYEDQRVQEKIINNQKWQWDYKSKEFSSNYLGHILHYVEGMILEVRDKQQIKK